MALKLKKEIKKSSYYVWFLGAKESKGLRGLEYILPVIGNLEERERDIEPFKVTLQISSKGLKITQNIVSSQNNKKPKNETIKHFIPHNTITCVHQKDDIIACILLLFNPVTKCPLHVHAYRCDSLETAALLKSQLQLLIEKPENQKKFAEIEGRLVAQEKKAKKERLESSIGSSDTGTSTKSESSEERFSSDRVATLYDSVAAELRAKLNKNDVPILLPPRDYDTVHRQKGNLTGIELRRCLNTNIVGQNVKAKRMASSGGSSGIGSDHAPSPESPDVQERYQDGHSTSDEDWNADQDTGLYLIDQPTYQSPVAKYDYRAEQRKPREFDQKVTRQHLEEHIRKKLEQRNKYHGQESFNYKEDYRNEKNASYQNQSNHSNHQKQKPERIERYSNSRFSYEESSVDDTIKRSQRGSQRYPTKDSKENNRDMRETRERNGRYIEQDYKNFKDRNDYNERTLNMKEMRSRDVRDLRDKDLGYPEVIEDIQVSPRERFNDAKEKFMLLEKRTSNTSQEYFREAPISPVCKDKRSSRYYEEEPIPAPRNFNKQMSSSPSPREAPTPLERYRLSQQKADKYDVKRRSMFNLSTSPPSNSNGPDYNYRTYESGRYPDEAISKDMKRRSYMENGYRTADYRERDEFRDNYREDFRDNRNSREREREENHREVHREAESRTRESRHLKEDREWSSRERASRDQSRDFRDSRDIRREVREARDHREKESDLRDFSRDPRESRDIRESRDVVRDSRDFREMRSTRDIKDDVQMREKGIRNGPNQRYRNSYAEPISHGLENSRKYVALNGSSRNNRFEVLHRTNSTVSNNGRVGIASIHPY